MERFSMHVNTHVSALQSSIGDDPRTVSGLRAVSDDFALDVTDLRVVVLGGTEQAEIVDLRRREREGERKIKLDFSVQER